MKKNVSVVSGILVLLLAALLVLGAVWLRTELADMRRRQAEREKQEASAPAAETEPEETAEISEEPEPEEEEEPPAPEEPPEPEGPTEEEIAAERRKRYDALASGEQDVWAYFDGTVLVGDSRVVGFSMYGFLPERRVLAENGATIVSADWRIDGIRAADPATIFIAFGTNDLHSHVWPEPEDWTARVRETIVRYQEEFPDAVLVINSILAILEPSKSTDPLYARVPEFNEALKALCAETGCLFVDNDFVVEEHGNLYAADGIHFAKELYPYWAAAMIETVLEAEEDARNGAAEENTGDMG